MFNLKPSHELKKNEAFLPVHTLISKQAKLTPNKSAVVYGEKKLTYQQLEQYTNTVAYYLQKKGVQSNTTVAVFLQPGITAIVSILGILKAGATYVPLSVHHPKERIQSIVKLSKSSHVICQEVHRSFFSEDVVTPIFYDSIDLAEKKEVKKTETSQSDTAYILFTSGSTGTPKGVKISHKNLLYYTQWAKTFFKTTVDNKLPLTSEIIFAAAVSQLYSCLMAGETLHLVPNSLGDPEALFDWYQRHPDYGLYCVPSVWVMALAWYKDNKNKNLIPPKTLFLSGEDVPKSLIAETQLLFPNVVIWNLYGPTEAVANLSCKRVTSEDDISIGSPLPKTTFYVVKEDGSEAKVGEQGILYASGPGISSGYLDNDELTNRTFFKYSSVADGVVRVYNTGDYVKRIATNEYRFAGRKDQQVKINGQRIELNEIENTLTKHPFVGASVVVYKDNRIIAYVKNNTDSKVSITSLRSFLQEYLPSVMIPEQWVFMDDFPVLANGKINRKQLPKPQYYRPNLEAEYIAPSIANEKKIIAVFERVLSLKGIGLNDNFFELGGNSLKAVSLIIEVTQEFNSSIGFQAFFENPTPAGLLSKLLSEKTVEKQVVEKGKLTMLPLRTPQKDLWFFQQAYPENAAYNIAYTIALKGTLDIEVFENALQTVIRQNEAFALKVKAKEGTLYWAFEHRDYKLPIETVTVLAPQERQHYIDSEITTLASKPFDINDWMYRFGLYKIDDQNYVLGFVVHHLIFDGESLSNFCKQLSDAYRKKETENVPSLSDVTQLQSAYLKTNAYKGSLRFWENYLANISAINGIPKIYQRTTKTPSEGAAISGYIDSQLKQQLEALCVQKGLTLNMVFLSAFAVVLHKIGNQKEYLIAMPFANRLSQNEQHAIGYLSNTLFVRAKCDPQHAFTDLVNTIKSDVIQILDHQQVPLSELIGMLRKQGVPIPLTGFKTLFAYHNNTPFSLEENELKLFAKEVPNDHAKCDVHFECFDNTTDIELKLTYNKSVLDSAFAMQFVRMMVQVVSDVVKNIETPIENLLTLSSEERKAVLRHSVGVKKETQSVMTLYHLFNETAKTNPDAPAIAYYDTTLTYQQLQQRISQLVQHLNTLSLKGSKPIAIYIDHSPEMLVAILAVSAMAIPYVPIDPSYPSKRIKYIIAHAEVDLVLTVSHQDTSLLEDKTVVCIDEIDDQDTQMQAVVSKTTASDLLYIIYTSGSTGNPKGVMVPNKGVANYLLWMRDAFKTDTTTRVLAKTSISFDISIWELFLPLVSGGMVVIRKRSDMESPDQIATVINDHGVTIAQFVPSGLKIFNDADMIRTAPSLKHIFCGGEKMPTSLQSEVLSNFKGQLHNLYGPTEASIFMSHYRCMPQMPYANIPIGTPIFNAEMYVLDQAQQLVPRGLIGHLYIGGDILASGYWNNKEQTQSAFVDCVVLGGKRLYKTGDMGRMLPDGTFEFCGRDDHQIKIRGYRVEPGEIEATLLQYPGIVEALVFKNKVDEDDERLNAVFVTNRVIDTEDLKKVLRERLPKYMMPSAFIEVDSIPKLPNGKIDVKALQQKGEPTQQHYKQQTLQTNSKDIEGTLYKIWAEVIGHDKFSQTDNFFDAGGHSVLFLKIKEKIKEQLGADFSIVDLYQYPNIKSIAEQYRKKYMNTASETISAVRSRIELKKRNYGKSRRK